MPSSLTIPSFHLHISKTSSVLSQCLFINYAEDNEDKLNWKIKYSNYFGAKTKEITYSTSETNYASNLFKKKSTPDTLIYNISIHSCTRDQKSKGVISFYIVVIEKKNVPLWRCHSTNYIPVWQGSHFCKDTVGKSSPLAEYLSWRNGFTRPCDYR